MHIKIFQKMFFLKNDMGIICPEIFAYILVHPIA